MAILKWLALLIEKALLFDEGLADGMIMNKLIDHWMALPEAEFRKVLNWTPEPMLFKMLHEDMSGRLRDRLQAILTAAAYESFCRRAILSRRSISKKAA